MQIRVKETDHKGRELSFLCGYDEVLKYVFMCIYHDEVLIFDNLALFNALEIEDFGFYKEIASARYGVDLTEVESDINKYLIDKGIKK